MLCLGRSIRLTRDEEERFLDLTGFPPDGIRTLADLDTYILACKHFYWGVSWETRFLHRLIDQERQRCLEGVPVDCCSD